ncbi:MAG: histidine phosphatase family protein [Pseudomonadota bacterium]
MKLILLRHAKSSWSDPWQDDHDRPLNDRGRRDAPRIGGWLRAKGHLPSLTLCSTATRTRETLATLALPPHGTRFRDDLYHAAPATILTLARAQSTACLLIIGHNPGIAEAAAKACRTPPRHPKFDAYPTAACTVIDISESWPGTLQGFVVPADLRA